MEFYECEGQMDLFDYIESDNALCDICWKVEQIQNLINVDDKNVCANCYERVYGGVPSMPHEFFGKENKSGGYTKSAPREWTEKEIEWIKKLKNDGYSIQQIADSTDRTPTSISIKLKRLSKNHNNYNKDHYEEKYRINEDFLNIIEPKNVLDLYVGEKDFYKDYNRVTNDKNKNIKADYHNDALKTLCDLYSKSQKFDLIDLDPFGSAFDCFDIAIKMAKKGIVITFGELGHKRFKRLDYVKNRYSINNLDDFTLDNLIKVAQRIGKANKKNLIIYKKIEWKNIGRVWFLIDEIKITEQWE